MSDYNQGTTFSAKKPMTVPFWSALSLAIFSLVCGMIIASNQPKLYDLFRGSSSQVTSGPYTSPGPNYQGSQQGNLLTDRVQGTVGTPPGHLKAEGSAYVETLTPPLARPRMSAIDLATHAFYSMNACAQVQAGKQQAYTFSTRVGPEGSVSISCQAADQQPRRAKRARR